MDEKSDANARTVDQEDMEILNRLLGCHTIQGSREEVCRFRIRVGELANINGDAWVRRNSERILAQWKMVLRLNRQDYER